MRNRQNPDNIDDRSKKRKQVTRNIKKISPAKSDARDEGPRLIPLTPRKPEEKHYQKILELADILLKPKG